jgi:hypothetical protein
LNRFGLSTGRQAMYRVFREACFEQRHNAVVEKKRL